MYSDCIAPPVVRDISSSFFLFCWLFIYFNRSIQSSYQNRTSTCKSLFSSERGRWRMGISWMRRTLIKTHTAGSLLREKWWTAPLAELPMISSQTMVGVGFWGACVRANTRKLQLRRIQSRQSRTTFVLWFAHLCFQKTACNLTNDKQPQRLCLKIVKQPHLHKQPFAFK